MSKDELNPESDIGEIEKSAKGKESKKAKKQENAELATDISKELIKTGIYKTNRESEQIFYYKDGIYNRNGEAQIKEAVHERLNGTESTNLCGEVIGKVQRGTYIDSRAFFEHEAHRIVLENGILDLDDYSLFPHDPEWLSLNKFPVHFNKNAECPGIL